MSGIHGSVTDKSQLPTDEDLDCPEIKLTSVPLFAGARHFIKHCYAQNNEFWLCRQETRDPRKCIKEGKFLTLCALEFFDKVKENCPKEFEKFYSCLDWYSSSKEFYRCKKKELGFDYCMYKKLGLTRFPQGYLSRPHIHNSMRPIPKLYQGRNYPDDYYKEVPSDILNPKITDQSS